MAESAFLLEVSPPEAGQKLLQFLLRRMPLPQSLLHRWIRTGQIRVNGGRAKPFVRVAVGDIVRLPPFASAMIASAAQDATAARSRTDGTREPAFASTGQTDPAPPPESTVTAPRMEGWGRGPSPSAAVETAAAGGADALPPLASRPLGPCALPPVVFSDAELFVFNKPAGLPVHGGTGQSDSLAARIAAHSGDAPFLPTPAHRLDKDTSGLILVARSYTMLRQLQDALREGGLHKEYVAWVEGHWPFSSPRLVRHRLGKSYAGHDERVRVDAGRAERDAACVVHCVQQQAPCSLWPRGRSLLLIRLLTGRTHQIRVQLAEEGHPLCGDGKYGRGGGALRLHAVRLILPDGREFTVLPPWQGQDAVTHVPPLLTCPPFSDVVPPDDICT